MRHGHFYFLLRPHERQSICCESAGAAWSSAFPDQVIKAWVQPDEDGVRKATLP